MHCLGATLNMCHNNLHYQVDAISHAAQTRSLWWHWGTRCQTLWRSADALSRSSQQMWRAQPDTRTIQTTESRPPRVWHDSPTDRGTVLATDWSGVQIEWDNGKTQFFHHNNMTEVSNACVYRKPHPIVMPRWDRLSWRDDRAVPLCSMRPGLAIQVEVAA